MAKAVYYSGCVKELSRKKPRKTHSITPNFHPSQIFWSTANVTIASGMYKFI